MTRKQINDIAVQIERTYNSRHTNADMQITTEVHFADRLAWISITPAEAEHIYGATIYFPEEILPFASVYGLTAHFDVLHVIDEVALLGKELPSGKNFPCINFFFHGDMEG